MRTTAKSRDCEAQVPGLRLTSNLWSEKRTAQRRGAGGASDRVAQERLRPISRSCGRDRSVAGGGFAADHFGPILANAPPIQERPLAVDPGGRFVSRRREALRRHGSARGCADLAQQGALGGDGIGPRGAGSDRERSGNERREKRSPEDIASIRIHCNPILSIPKAPASVQSSRA